MKNTNTNNNKNSRGRLSWDDWYSSENCTDLESEYCPWLEIYLTRYFSNPQVIVLDLGCGRGFDANFLSKNGVIVIACDYSWSALFTAKTAFPHIPLIQSDIRDGLPFRHTSFTCVVANLSLHYFSDTETKKILDDINNILLPEGVLIARLNSKKDQNYQLISKEKELKIEKDFFICDGLPRRFFDENSIDTVFSDGWKILNKQEKEINRYKKTKTQWELVVKKTCK